MRAKTQVTGTHRGDARQDLFLFVYIKQVINDFMAQAVSRRAVLKTSSSMAGVSRPVCVFCRLGWYEATSACPLLSLTPTKVSVLEAVLY